MPHSIPSWLQSIPDVVKLPITAALGFGLGIGERPTQKRLTSKKGTLSFLRRSCQRVCSHNRDFGVSALYPIQRTR